MRKFSTLGRLTILLLAAACGNNGTGNIPRRDTAAVDSPAGAVAVPIAPATSAARAGARSIIFFGNSLTAGYGVNPSEAFPALIQDRIDSLKLPYKVTNAGLSGETSAGGRNRIGWILRQPVDIFVLELGANDGLRGIPISETVTNLQAILDSVKGK